MTKAVPRRKRPPRKPLRELFEEHDGKVSDKWFIYLETYERIFSTFRTRPVRILEIGVQNGGSLEIWGKYFPTADVIVGCDINPDCRKLEFDDARIRLIVGDVNSAKIEREILATSSEYDIVIDDGSHNSSDIIHSFARYFRYLAPNGVYIVEDLHCSYWQKYQGGFYDPYSSMSFFKRLLDVVNSEHWGVPRKRTDALSAFARRYSVSFDEIPLASIHSLQFINSLCVIEKCHAIENELGERKIAGQVAVISDGCTPLRDHLSKPSDETENPWSLDLLTLEEEIEANRKLVSAQSVHIKQLESEAKSASVAEKALAETQAKLREAESASAAAQERAKRLEGEGASARQRLGKQEQQISELKAGFDNRGRALKGAGKALSEARAKLGTAEKATAAEQEKASRLERELGSERHRLGEAEQQISRLNSELESRTHAAEEAERSLVEVRHQLAQTESALVQRRHEAEETAGELAATREDLRQTAAARAEAEKGTAILTEHIVLLMADVKERQAAFATMQQARAAESAETDKAIAAVAKQVRQVLAVLETSRHELATRLSESEQARARQSTELQQQADEIAALKRQVNEKQCEARRAVAGLLNGHNSQSLWRPFRLRRQITLLKRSGLFDAEWYLRQYTDVASAGMDPLRHYVEFGAKEGRAPNPALAHANGETEVEAASKAAPEPDALPTDADQEGSR